ncbi:glycosyltransferase family 1 protein [Desulfonema ishimotonii]|uniref:Glycosyltransferase family 1 protein n=1 Tax=Desulfonema ishimotonii TaxID=45657 RepID=A0A401G3R4_9BACT|nr:glycosyltransferase [Desulfonema ishimotonii]GBC63755.1 glycosyltransferase family 1 protein [Desulfonema ishimotonii]
MIKDKNMICFAPADWRWYGSCKRLMSIFSHHNKILYINHISISTPSIKETGTKVFIKRLLRKLKTLSRPFRKENENLYSYSPLIFPGYHGVIKKWNQLLLRFQIQFLQKILHLSNPVVWIENPVGITVAKNVNPELILYYRTDKFESYRELRDRQDILSLEEKLTHDAAIILCVSSKLYEEKLRFRKKNVYYIPHGVDFTHFNNAIKDPFVPEEIKHIRHPVVGYFGSLSNSNDEALIHYCATERPEISFVLIGTVLGEFKLIRDLPNVYFLGYKNYTVLPDYAKNFDVCIMFWKVTEWIEHCNPVKTMEYLAMGKPVVSVAIDDICKNFKGIISIAKNCEEFLAKIEEELGNDSPEKQKKRIAFVENETWEARAEVISRVMEKNWRRAVTNR